jgi:lipid-A-disaccharide synthase
VKYYIIAGEASGDLHGSNLMKAIALQDEAAQFRVWGGDKMKAAGGEVVKHIKELAFMGFWEVLKNLRTILKNIDFCKKDILQWQPDVVVLIDYPGFNFRLLPFLKTNHFKIAWYIAPQVWAWKESRTKLLKQYVDELLVIFPFEVKFFEAWGMQPKFVGHPLLDVINSVSNKPINSKIIALLPGSRKQEIEKMLPLYAKVSKHFPDYEFWVAGMSIHGEDYYNKLLKRSKCILKIDATYEVLQQAQAALVTSGTATMETALLKVPQVVCYKGSWFSYFIGRMLVKVPFIAIVNLVSQKKVVTELIQHEANETQVEKELHTVLKQDVRENMMIEYELLREKLGGSGASAKAARVVVSLAIQQ